MIHIRPFEAIKENTLMEMNKFDEKISLVEKYSNKLYLKGIQIFSKTKSNIFFVLDEFYYSVNKKSRYNKLMNTTVRKLARCPFRKLKPHVY
jgi:queuine/archaeosine tRNA-ribosyltransferase